MGGINMEHFEASQLSKYDRELSRGTVSRQIVKICYGCKKGFCKRKGRAKAAPVINNPVRFVCQNCADKLVNGGVVEGITVLNESLL
jgi:hypothetical protein